MEVNDESREIQILAETSVLHFEASGASCTDKVGSGPDGCEQNVCTSVSGKNETFGISRVCGHQDSDGDMQTVLSFSSPRSKTNIYMNKSVKTLTSFHATAVLNGEGGSSRMGEFRKSILTSTKKRGLEGDSSDEFYTNSDLAKSPGRQPLESPAKRLRQKNIFTG